MDDSQPTRSDLLTALSRIVSAHLGNTSTSMNARDVPDFIRQVHRTLTGLEDEVKTDVEKPSAIEAQPSPAVPIEDSIRHDHLVCLEDGKQLKMLKRYLRARFDMAPDEYRRKWGLPRDYPMVAPAYAAHRSALAQRYGLGATKKTPVETPSKLPTVRYKRKDRSAGDATAAAPPKKKRNFVRLTSRSAQPATD